MSRTVVARRVDRLLLARGLHPVERQQQRGGELVLYYAMSDTARKARAYLIQKGIACEQFNIRVTVFLDAEEEPLKARSA